MIEREIKLPFESAAEARRAIVALGAVPYRARRLQDDALLDTDEWSLQQRGCALRLRRDGTDAYVTFKGPVIPGVMKEREEIETTVGSTDATDVLLRIFNELGYTPRFRYQKYREEFRLGTMIVALDETPVGTFIELEGQELDITAAAELLGKTPADYVLTSYRSLFLAYRQAHGVTAPDMLFTASPS
jgi:adenylate cyclase class 2